jgi:zinc/manganese transport system permease protein
MPAPFQWLLDPWQSAIVGPGAAVTVVVGASAAAIGCWVLLRDLPYAAESLSHGMFPGLVAASLLGVPIAIGGIAGLAVAAAAITAARRWVSPDNHSVAVAITPLLGLGAILALSGPVPPGVGDALFGDVLAADTTDLLTALVLTPVLLVLLRAAHWRLLASGVRSSDSSRIDTLVICLLVVATAMAAGSLGALLAVALIIGPASAAERMALRASRILWLAASIAALSAVVGIEVAWHAGIAAGPTIAICAIIPAAASALLLPKQITT